MSTKAERPHWLYRCFGASGELLYIGISADVSRRIQIHATNGGTWWAGQIHGVEIGEVYPSRLLARKAERAAVIAEMPRWNVEYKIGRLAELTPAELKDVLIASLQTHSRAAGWARAEMSRRIA